MGSRQTTFGQLCYQRLCELDQEKITRRDRRVINTNMKNTLLRSWPSIISIIQLAN